MFVFSFNKWEVITLKAVLYEKEQWNVAADLMWCLCNDFFLGENVDCNGFWLKLGKN